MADEGKRPDPADPADSVTEAGPGSDDARRRPARVWPADDQGIADWTDVYFRRTKEAVSRFGDCQVTYALFMRRPVVSAPRVALDWLQSVAKRRGFEVEIDQGQQALHVAFEGVLDADVGAADVRGVLREDRVADERLAPVGVVEGGQARGVAGKVDGIEAPPVHLEGVAVDERLHLARLPAEVAVVLEELDEFDAGLLGHSPLPELLALEPLFLEQALLVARDEGGVGLVDVDRRTGLGLDCAREPGVVGVPVSEEDPVDVREVVAEIREPGRQLFAHVGERDAGVDEDEFVGVAAPGGAVEHVDVVESLENGVREPDPLHTERCSPDGKNPSDSGRGAQATSHVRRDTNFNQFEHIIFHE